ncbi:MAG: T9SS type A sorting domain-containing protein [Bacteroidetes bacterium]|nr:T9SS type A sorting domain-containing protein [Bacteroidota bacterium]
MIHSGVQLEVPRLSRAAEKFVSEVYPNPTTGPVSIRLNLPEAGRVSVIVTDATGQQVRSRVDMYLSAGRSELPLSLEGLSNGVYLVHFQYTENKMSIMTRHRVLVTN